MLPSTPYRPHQPTVPTILTSQRKHRLTHSHTPRKTPQETIIDADVFNQGKPKKKKSQGIRAQIDTCLQAIGVAYGQQKGQISTVHRVDSALIVQYMGKVQQDYKLQDPFGPIPQSVIRPQRKDWSQGRPLKRDDSKKKTFITLTLSGKSSDRIYSVHKNREGSTQKNTFRSRIPIFSPYTISAPEPRRGQGSKIAEQNSKIAEQFRYCINCETPILSQNIGYHQQHECSQLKNLYKMSFTQLRDLVLDKITSLKKRVTANIQKLKNINERPGEQLIAQIDAWNQKSNRQTELFKSKINAVFMQSIELTQKVNWFTRVYAKLRTYQNSQGATPKEFLMKNTHSRSGQPGEVSKFDTGQP